MIDGEFIFIGAHVGLESKDGVYIEGAGEGGEQGESQDGREGLEAEEEIE